MQTQAGLTHIFWEGVYAKMNNIVEAMGRIPIAKYISSNDLKEDPGQRGDQTAPLKKSGQSRQAPRERAGKRCVAKN